MADDAPDSSRFSYPRLTQVVPARSGAAFEVRDNERLQILDQSGKQVCALAAIRRDDPNEWLSPSHTREGIGSIMLTTGSVLVSNRRGRLLQIEEDTVGRHDLLLPACDARRYLDHYGLQEHASCRDNLASALEPHGVPDDRVPDPVNIFGHIAVLGRGEIEIREPLSEANDYIVFRVLTDLVVAVSACPQDRNSTNGYNPTDLLVRIFAE